MLKRATNGGARSALRRLQHSSQQLPNTGLVAAAIELQVGARHAPRRNLPLLAETDECRSRELRVGGFQIESRGHRKKLFRGDTLRQGTKIGITGDGNRGNDV